MALAASLGENRCSGLGETVAPSRRGYLRPYNRAHEARTPHARLAVSRPSGPRRNVRVLPAVRHSADHRRLRIIRGGKPSQDKFDRLADPLLAAEATLAYALCREAYRRLGYNPKLVRLDLADLPTDSIALMARIRSYMDQPGAEPLARLKHTTPTSCAGAGSAHQRTRPMVRCARAAQRPMRLWVSPQSRPAIPA